MGAIFGFGILDLSDPSFGYTDDDAVIGTQYAAVALDTPPGTVDAFPEYGFELKNVTLRAMSPTEVAMLPLEVRTALEQEPAFVSAEVVVTQQSQVDTSVTMALACSITTATGDAVGYTAPVSP